MTNTQTTLFNNPVLIRGNKCEIRDGLEVTTGGLTVENSNIFQKVLHANAGISTDKGITFPDSTHQATRGVITLTEGSNVTITDNGNGNFTIASAGAGIAGITSSYDGHIEFPNNFPFSRYYIDSRAVTGRTIKEFSAVAVTGPVGCSATLHGRGIEIAKINIPVVTDTPTTVTGLNQTLPVGATLELRIKGITTGQIMRDMRYSVGFTV